MESAARQRVGAWIVGSLLLVCAAGCGSTPPPKDFLHQFRLDYVLTDAEIEKLEFFISARVLVRAEGDTPVNDPTGSGVIIAPLGTRGKVVDVGPDWLRVTFGLGNGVFFKTDASKPFDQYWLATEVEGQDGLFELREHPDLDLWVEGTSYEVLFGRDAYLLMSAESWKRFVATRTHAPGA
jgi:hypothetical protein